jgi:hypothetical protein
MKMEEHHPSSYSSAITFLLKLVDVASATPKQEKSYGGQWLCVFILLPWAHNCREVRASPPSALIAVRPMGFY